MRDKVRFMPVPSRRKHIHHWKKSLAGGFRCDCEAWRYEFAEGIQQCETASERGRRYCLTHLVSRPTSVSSQDMQNLDEDPCLVSSTSARNVEKRAAGL
jgi:hypothetical protein